MDENITFEQANLRLSEVVGRLDDNNLTLKESVDLYAEACELMGYCVDMLENYRGRITDIHEKLMQKYREEENEN